MLYKKQCSSCKKIFNHLYTTGEGRICYFCKKKTQTMMYGLKSPERYIKNSLKINMNAIQLDELDSYLEKHQIKNRSKFIRDAISDKIRRKDK